MTGRARRSAHLSYGRVGKVRSQIRRAPESVTGTQTLRRQPHRARRCSWSHDEAAPERCGAASSHRPGQRSPQDVAQRVWLYHRRCHAPVTNYADPSGPRCLDLLFRTHHGLTWTPIDGLYNLCHVVPSEGPRIRTGASSGPSKRYCRVFGGVSLTPQTLSRLTDAPKTRGCGKPVRPG